MCQCIGFLIFKGIVLKFFNDEHYFLTPTAVVKRISINSYALDYWRVQSLNIYFFGSREFTNSPVLETPMI